MGARVLVAEDGAIMRKLISKALHGVGATEIVEAENGEQALKLFESHPFDLVLLDWHMPELNGLEAARAIRAGGSRVPIIMVTAEADRDHVLEAIRAGATDYVLKPFQYDALKEKLSRFCGGKAGIIRALKDDPNLHDQDPLMEELAEFIEGRQTPRS